MPNRMIKDSIKTSDSVNSLSWFAEVVFYRLLLTADDYGRMDGRSIVLRNILFPTRDDVSTEQVSNAIEEIKKENIIFDYVVDDKKYLCFPNFSKYQNLRAKSSKYPAPPEDMLYTCHTHDTHVHSTCMLEEEVEVEEEKEVEVEKKELKEKNFSLCVDGDRVTETNKDSCDRTRGEIAGKDDSRTRGEAIKVLNFLNSSVNSNYRSCESTLKPIIARLNEGYSVDDCESVINKKCAEWLTTDMAKFLRPSTLFAKSHFEEYLNAPAVVKRSSSGNQRKVAMPDYWGEKAPVETMSEEEMRDLVKLQEEMSK